MPLNYDMVTSPSRPQTAPPGGQRGTTSFAEIFSQRDEKRPSTALNISRQKERTKFEELENKPIKTAGTGRPGARGKRLAANLLFSPKIPVRNNVKGGRKRTSPFKREPELWGSDGENDSGDAALLTSKLTLIKDVALRKTKKATRKSTENLLSSPTAAQPLYKGEYSPDKYSPKNHNRKSPTRKVAENSPAKRVIDFSKDVENDKDASPALDVELESQSNPFTIPILGFEIVTKGNENS